jgi:hypothetical protein
VSSAATQFAERATRISLRPINLSSQAPQRVILDDFAASSRTSQQRIRSARAIRFARHPQFRCCISQTVDILGISRDFAQRSAWAA